MNTKRALAASFLVLLSACTAECSCGGDNGDGDSSSSQGGGSTTGITVSVGTGGSGGGGTGGAGTGGEGTGGGGTTTDATVRLAHFSPDSLGVNVCLIDGDGVAIGPLLDGGFEFGDTTEYTGINSGTYGVVLTAAAATSCGTPLFSAEGLEILEGETLTVAAVGLAGADEGDDTALQIIGYVDDVAAPDAGNVKARFVHAAPGAPAVDVGYYDETDTFVPVWEGASYPNDSGYQELPAFDNLTLVARAAGTETDLLTVDVSGPDGGIVEGFAIGSPASGIQVLTINTAP